jgi:short-subunit dehydrogenase
MGATRASRSFRRALVTGASSGLGRAIAVELGRRGADVVLIARRADELETTADLVRAAGGQATPFAFDVSDTDALGEALLELDGLHGGFDLVLANAGIGASGPIQSRSWSELRAVLRIDAEAAIATLLAVLAPMQERGRGTLAATSSVAARRGLPLGGTYPAAKAALSSFLETLGAELDGTGIRVCDLQPGFVRTPMTDDLPYPLPFLVEVDEAARLCVRALERGRALYTFPWQMALAARLARVVPAGLWRKMAGYAARRMR